MFLVTHMLCFTYNGRSYIIYMSSKWDSNCEKSIGRDDSDTITISIEFKKDVLNSTGEEIEIICRFRTDGFSWMTEILFRADDYVSDENIFQGRRFPEWRNSGDDGNIVQGRRFREGRNSMDGGNIVQDRRFCQWRNFVEQGNIVQGRRLCEWREYRPGQKIPWGTELFGWRKYFLCTSHQIFVEIIYLLYEEMQAVCINILFNLCLNYLWIIKCTGMHLFNCEKSQWSPWETYLPVLLLTNWSHINSENSTKLMGNSLQLEKSSNSIDGENFMNH